MRLLDTAYTTVARELPAAVRQVARYTRDPLGPLHGPSTAVTRLRADLKPVILVHGFASVPSHLSAWLGALGQGVAAYSLGYPSVGYAIDETADCLADQIRCIATWHGRHVSVVGHSLGGLLLRDAILRGSLEHHVDVCVTVCSPHRGSRWADLLRQSHILSRGASLQETIHALEHAEAADGYPHSVRMITIAASDDLVVPAETALLPHAEQVLLRGAGHLSAIEHPVTLGVLASLG